MALKKNLLEIKRFFLAQKIKNILEILNSTHPTAPTFIFILAIASVSQNVTIKGHKMHDGFLGATSGNLNYLQRHWLLFTIVCLFLVHVPVIITTSKPIICVAIIAFVLNDSILPWQK